MPRSLRAHALTILLLNVFVMRTLVAQRVGLQLNR